MTAETDITAEPAGIEAAALSAALLGQGLSPEAEALLQAAGACYAEDARAEALLEEAYAIAPDHPAVLIGLYRFYFYKGRLNEALTVGLACVDKACRELGLDPDWRAVKPDDAAFGQFDAVLPRFLLFSLKGYAYLSMRLGALDAGRAAVAKLLELDPTDKIGAQVLADVLAREGRDEDELELTEG